MGSVPPSVVAGLTTVRALVGEAGPRAVGCKALSFLVTLTC